MIIRKRKMKRKRILNRMVVIIKMLQRKRMMIFLERMGMILRKWNMTRMIMVMMRKRILKRMVVMIKMLQKKNNNKTTMMFLKRKGMNMRKWKMIRMMMMLV